MSERGQFSFKMQTTTMCNYNYNSDSASFINISLGSYLAFYYCNKKSEIINLAMSILAYCFRGSNPCLVGPGFVPVVR